jgi:hypothetical protein
MKIVHFILAAFLLVVTGGLGDETMQEVIFDEELEEDEPYYQDQYPDNVHDESLLGAEK